MEELARQIQCHLDAYSELHNVSWADSRLYTGSRRAGDALVPSLRRHVARHIKEFRETEPTQRRSRGRVWWYAGGAGGDDAADWDKVRAPTVDGTGRVKADKSRARGRKRERRPAAGLTDSGGLGVELPCASAKRSRLLPDFFDDWSYVGRRLSLLVVERVVLVVLSHVQR